MYCVKCGKEVKDGTKFCTNCGTEIEAKKEKKAEKDEKLTYSQNKSIETTSNPTPTEVKPAEAGDGKATASLVLGIISVVFLFGIGFITSIVGLILGICSKKSGKKTAGIILNAIALGLSIIVPIIIISFYGSLLFWIPTTTTTTGTTTPGIVTPSTRPSTGRTTSTGTITFDGFEITLGNNYQIITDDKTYSGHYGESVIKLPATIKNVSADSDHLNMFYYYYYAPDGTKIDSVRSDFGSALDAIDYVHVDRGLSKVQYFYILYKGDGKYKIDFKNTKDQKTIEFTIKK